MCDHDVIYKQIVASPKYTKYKSKCKFNLIWKIMLVVDYAIHKFICYISPLYKALCLVESVTISL